MKDTVVDSWTNLIDVMALGFQIRFFLNRAPLFPQRRQRNNASDGLFAALGKFSPHSQSQSILLSYNLAFPQVISNLPPFRHLLADNNTRKTPGDYAWAERLVGEKGKGTKNQLAGEMGEGDPTVEYIKASFIQLPGMWPLFRHLFLHQSLFVHFRWNLPL